MLNYLKPSVDFVFQLASIMRANNGTIYQVLFKFWMHGDRVYFRIVIVFEKYVLKTEIDIPEKPMKPYQIFLSLNSSRTLQQVSPNLTRNIESYPWNNLVKLPSDIHI